MAPQKRKGACQASNAVMSGTLAKLPMAPESPIIVQRKPVMACARWLK